MSRPVAVVICVLIAVAILAAMRWGWVRRVRRTGEGLAPLPEVWQPEASEMLAVEGTYVSTTSAGEWLDRVAAAGLGVRSPVIAHVDSRGLLLARRGAPDVAIPSADLVVARRERGIAGKVAQAGGLVVVRWRLGDRELDTGLRPRYSRDLDPLVDAVNSLVGSTQKGLPRA